MILYGWIHQETFGVKQGDPWLHPAFLTTKSPPATQGKPNTRAVCLSVRCEQAAAEERDNEPNGPGDDSMVTVWKNM